MGHVLPDYTGSGLVNLIAELELRLVGSAPSPRLSDSALVPEAAGYVVVAIDGVGDLQLGHASASVLSHSQVATLTAGFPTTTTTSLATVATGLAPTGHGIIGHILHLPGVAEAVNVLKWVTPQGVRVEHDYASVLPSPNLWERLALGGIEPITVQPGPFMGTPLSQMLYRGCRFEPAWTVAELVEATLAVSGPGRLVVTYYPNVDVAAHLHGQKSAKYAEPLEEAGRVWERLAIGLADGIGMVGVSDHGHIDYSPAGKLLIRDRRYGDLRFFGDSRSTFVSGPLDLIAELATETSAVVVERSELMTWLGPGPAHPDLESRLPDRLLLAPTGKLLLPRGFDKRLIGYHGGLDPAEIQIPLLAR